MNSAVLVLCVALAGAKLVPPSSIVPRDRVAAAAYYEQIGDALASWGAYEAAIANYRSSLSRADDRPRAQLGLATCLVRASRPYEATGYVQAVLKRDPKNLDAQRLYSELILRSGRPDEAETRLRELVRRHQDDAASHRLLGLSLLAQRKPREAEVEFRTAARLNPNDAEAYDGLARTMLALDHKLAAMAALRKLIELRPQHLGALTMLAEMYVEAARYADALELGLRLVALEPNNPQFLLGVAQMYDRLQQSEKAVDFYRRAYPLVIEPDRLFACASRLAQHHYGKGEFAAAAGYLRRLIGLKPDFLPARMQLLQCYRLERNWSAAVGVARELVALKPGELGLRMQLFDLQLRAGNPAGAEASARTILARWPGQWQLYGQLAEGLFTAGYGGRAVAMLRQATQQFPEIRPLSYLLFELYGRLGRHDEAKALMRAVLRRDPNDVPARTELAAFAFQDQDYEQVVNLLQPLLENGRLRPDAAEALAWSYQWTGRHQQAWTIFERLAERSGDPLMMHNVARQAERLGQLDKVILIYKGILSKHPNHVPSLLGLGRAMANSGDIRGAVDIFAKVLEREPKHALALRNYALALYALGRDEEGDAAARRFAALYPDNPYALALAGDFKYDRGDTDAATAAWLEALQKQPTSSVLRRRLAQALEGRQRYAEAIAHYEAAARRESEDWFSRFRLTKLYERQGLFGEARRWWRDLADVLPDSRWVYRRWLATFNAEGDPALGLATGADLLARRPDNLALGDALVEYAAEDAGLPELRSRLDELLARRGHEPGLREVYGRALEALGGLDDALAWYRGQSALEPIEPRWRRGVGRVWERQGQPDLAAEAYREASRLAPGDPASLEDLARVQIAAGASDDAMQTLRKLVALNPTDADALLRLVRLYADAGRLAEARDGLKRLTEDRRDPARHADNPAVWTVLGAANELLGDLPAALEAYRGALFLDRDNRVAGEALARLQSAAPPRLRVGETTAESLFEAPRLEP